MKIKNTTITFGVSSHFFKTSVSLTFEGSEDFDEALALAKKQYFKALSQELRLSKKFDNMTFEEISKFLGKKL